MARVSSNIWEMRSWASSNQIISLQEEVAQWVSSINLWDPMIPIVNNNLITSQSEEVMDLASSSLSISTLNNSQKFTFRMSLSLTIIMPPLLQARGATLRTPLRSLQWSSMICSSSTPLTTGSTKDLY